MNTIVRQSHPAVELPKELRLSDDPRRQLRRQRPQYSPHCGRTRRAHPVFARSSLMSPDPHNRIVYPDPNTLIPAVEREIPFDAIHVATAGLNACDFFLSNDFKVGGQAEQRLRRLPPSAVAENR